MLNAKHFEEHTEFNAIIGGTVVHIFKITIDIIMYTKNCKSGN